MTEATSGGLKLQCVAIATRDLVGRDSACRSASDIAESECDRELRAETRRLVRKIGVRLTVVISKTRVR